VISPITLLSTSARGQMVNHDWYPSLLEHLPGAIYVLVNDCIAYANPAGLDLMKATGLHQLIGSKPETFLVARHHETVKQLLKNPGSPNTPDVQYYQCICLDGQSIDIEVQSKQFVYQSQAAILLSVREAAPHSGVSAQIHKLSLNDLVKVKANRVHEALHHEKEILEMIALDKPLSHILEDVCDRMERLLGNGSICAISLFDQSTQTLNFGAGPALPEEFSQQLHNISIGINNCSSAAAIFYNRLTIVQDIEVSPIWEKFKSIATEYGLRSCWSVPITTAFNSVLGTVDVYSKETHSPTEEEHAMIVDACDLIGLAIDKKIWSKASKKAKSAIVPWSLICPKVLW